MLSCGRAASLFVLGACLVAGCPPAEASDGVLEINQTCAEQTGCFPGDAPGFPVTIAASGSYRLTGNLDLASANATAIQVNASSVEIDLGGFTIKGNTVCSGVPISSCAPTGSGVGVLGGANVSVRHGIVTQLGNDGIRLDYSGRVEDVQAFQNGGSGIAVGNQGFLRGNQATSNGAYGIWTAIEAELDHNSSVGNKLAGFFVGGGVLTANVGTRNGTEGANLGFATAFSGNLLGHNSGNVSSVSVAGGKATGGNVCDDGRCTRTGAKRYYLTLSPTTGANALGACASGFHMASAWEVHEPSTLEYDTTLGYVFSDSGSGPPSTFGWIRNGSPTTVISDSSCTDWTDSTSSHAGTLAGPSDPRWWSETATRTGLWKPSSAACDQYWRVWCLED